MAYIVVLQFLYYISRVLLTHVIVTLQQTSASGKVRRFGIGRKLFHKETFFLCLATEISTLFLRRRRGKGGVAQVMIQPSILCFSGSCELRLSSLSSLKRKRARKRWIVQPYHRLSNASKAQYDVCKSAKMSNFDFWTDFGPISDQFFD